MSQRESKLSRAIMDTLRANDVFCFKIHGGPTMMAGLPDIVACVPVDVWTTEAYEAATPERHGWFVGFEVKNPDGGDPTPIQRRVHDNIRSACGAVYVVRSVQDALDALQHVGWHAVPPRS